MSEPSKGNDDRSERDKSQPHSPRVLDARQLFCGEREILIEHAGVRYRLRVTRRGRLILTK